MHSRVSLLLLGEDLETFPLDGGCLDPSGVHTVGVGECFTLLIARFHFLPYCFFFLQLVLKVKKSQVDSDEEVAVGGGVG